MKKLIIVCIVLLGLTACVETKRGETEKDGLATVENTMSEVGSVGDGTSMHSLEFVRTDGDTLYVFYENNAVGGLACGDIVSMEYFEHEGELTAKYIVNLTALCNEWKGVGDADNYSFTLKEDGSVASTGFDTAYNRWAIIDGQLTISESNADKAEKYDIVLLTEDSLVLKSDDETEMRMAK